LDGIEFTHSQGVLLWDINPGNLATGVGEKSHVVYLFNFDLVKLYIDSSTGAHMPYREGRVALGTLHMESRTAVLVLSL
ncbi:hypothetical protein EDB19DRAFT_1636216, partial [Suillus lakei]